MNVIVLGGNGLFGRKTVLHLLEDKEVSTVVSMDIAPPKEWFAREIEKHQDTPATNGEPPRYSGK